MAKNSNRGQGRDNRRSNNEPTVTDKNGNTRTLNEAKDEHGNINETNGVFNF